MAKVIISPVKRFSGSVTLSDPLTFPQALAVESAIRKGQALGDEGTHLQFDNVLLPAVLACVQEWNIAGVDNPTPETFPATPRTASAELIAWLIGEVMALYKDAEELPNE
jgi:hypothetical protein